MWQWCRPQFFSPCHKNVSDSEEPERNSFKWTLESGTDFFKYIRVWFRSGPIRGSICCYYDNRLLLTVKVVADGHSRMWWKEKETEIWIYLTSANTCQHVRVSPSAGQRQYFHHKAVWWNVVTFMHQTDERMKSWLFCQFTLRTLLLLTANPADETTKSWFDTEKVFWSDRRTTERWNQSSWKLRNQFIGSDAFYSKNLSVPLVTMKTERAKELVCKSQITHEINTKNMFMWATSV